MQDYRNLLVWQKAHTLTLNIYRISGNFPENERFGLTSQIRRGAASIAANIAEGCGRNGDKELARFLDIAQGSAMEVSYHALLAKDLNYLAENDFFTLETSISEVRRMLWAFTEKVRNTNL
jgi:four helix bundle protein